MGFVFRLEKVANYRQQQVDEHGRRVAAAERVIAGLIDRIGAIDAEIRRQLDDFHTDANGGISVQPMLARSLWVTHQEKLREATVRDLTEAEADLARCRTELNAAWRDLEVLNKLRERQKVVWQAEQSKRSNLEMDEIGQIRADRQRRSKVAM